ncbi:MAG: sulfatase-like hydrolase/transferase [Planctomycetes bacterium]|nr:sulfatase-like hydrolase/transferase [Planctomycetota bacterium]
MNRHGTMTAGKSTRGGTTAGLDRRSFLRVGATGLAASLWSLRSAAAAQGRTTGGPKAARRPNVLFVFSDMQRAYSMGCYGDANARTPVLDAFARQGARLDAALSNTPVCCPYRACLMSGQYAHHHGVMSNGVPFRPTVKCVAETFREAGYETGYAGKWHIIPPKDAPDPTYGFPAQGTEFGFYRTDRQSANVTDVALKFIAQKSQGDKPWLLFVSWILPHSPYQAPPGYAAHFSKITIPPNVPEGLASDNAQQCLPDYYGMIESLDDEFKRLLQALDQAGVAEDTIVVYSSDHGDMIGCQGLKAKRWPHEESARIPFLIRYPRAIRPGTVIADPFGSPDVYPTLAGLAGLRAPAGVDGADFSPLLRGETTRPPRDYVYLEMQYAYVPWPGWRALRTRRYMYARTKDKPWFLYDLQNDPWERKNLVTDPARQKLVQEFDDRLASVMRETGDSWDITAASGDLENWVPGGPKQRSQNLGTAFPGQATGPVEGNPKEKAKKNKRAQRQKAGT